MTKINKDEKLDEFHYHEALDRTYIMCQQLEFVLLSHPIIQKHKELREEVKKALYILYDIYQLIGNTNKEDGTKLYM